MVERGGCAWRLGSGAELRPLALTDGTELQGLIEANRDHLAAWLPWAAGQTLADTHAFLAEAQAQAAANDGFQAAIRRDGAIAGVCGFVGVDWANRRTTIGYWLAAEQQGRGLVTAAVAALADHALGDGAAAAVAGGGADLDPVQPPNPERLGFSREAIFRKAQQLGGRAHDLAVYARVAGDPPPGRDP